MKAGALLSVLLGLVVLAQATEILVNPEMNGCEISDGATPTPWTESYGSYSHDFYSHLFSSYPSGDTCFAYLNSVLPGNAITQTITVPSTGTYDFSGLVACFGDSSTFCDYSLTINGQNFPLSISSVLSADPTFYVPVTASGITLPAGTYD
eukprot:CAMPEP_0184335446 /NCGR_PEP_ID=MMETSP1089-20130417/4000_1 /TAXON_ID=38269 ORGANISM="Gloeochaete wittrockiana, Strain SAG46.84" /NCGR_SAMPLE_ID=MMETSP1089 /ASSEMBLY_ACC=CAM_ASM_000445 /LENGTH=150 /DNA_ID=CAMNT_0026660091 /DNA_START=8 /DNA_END=457 /DNA_ORIENTATION=+